MRKGLDKGYFGVYGLNQPRLRGIDDQLLAEARLGSERSVYSGPISGRVDCPIDAYLSLKEIICQQRGSARKHHAMGRPARSPLLKSRLFPYLSSSSSRKAKDLMFTSLAAPATKRVV
jgi:hypothetical protein